ncbi:MAG: response regulator transcription factor [Chloroflexi bacterium]|nr:response regulator transcription factor [Chloroflexota bacterium]
MTSPATGPLRLLVVEDEALYREMLATCLAGEPAFTVVGAFENGDQAVGEAERLNPAVAILDFELPGSMHGIDLGLALRRARPGLGIVLLSNHAVPQLLSTLPAEAVSGWSYLVKRSVADLASLKQAILAAAAGSVAIDATLVRAMRPRGGSPIEALTPEQREVLQLVAEGYSDAAIAALLGRDEIGVAATVAQIYDALAIDRHDRAVQPRVRAVLMYLQQTRLRGPVPRDLPSAS